MLLREIFDKEFIFESKKEDKKSTKIFYKIDINIKKPKVEEPNNDTEQNTQQPADVAAATPQQPTGVDLGLPLDTTSPQPTDVAAATPQPVDNNGIQNPDPVNAPAPTGVDLGLPLASVVTEDDDKDDVEINDENNIVRKLEGELVLDKEKVNNIQTVEDLLDVLANEKVDGVTVLDEFTSGILGIMATPTLQPQLKEKADKESKIFTEILYGKKREDSVGFRFIKRANSDMITTSMMIDNAIVNAPYKKETLDKRITDYRNNEYESKV